MQHLHVAAEDARRPALPAQVHVRDMRGATSLDSVPHLQGPKPRTEPGMGVEDVRGILYFHACSGQWAAPHRYSVVLGGAAYRGVRKAVEYYVYGQQGG